MGRALRKDLAVVLLAGGQSSRFGSDKAQVVVGESEAEVDGFEAKNITNISYAIRRLDIVELISDNCRAVDGAPPRGFTSSASSFNFQLRRAVGQNSLLGV